MRKDILDSMSEVDLLSAISEHAKMLIKSKKDAEQKNMACLSAPPRRWIRGGRFTTLQAKASRSAEYRDSLRSDLRNLIEKYYDNF